MKYAGWRTLGLLLTGLQLGVACAPAPARVAADPVLSPDSGTPAGIGLTLLEDRPFGVEGEVPLQLLAAGPEKLWARSQQALYLLDLQGRLLLRQPLPAAEDLTVPVSAAASSGQQLALALSWPRAGSQAAGSYLTFLAEAGLPAPASWIPLGGPASLPRLTWDSQAFVAAWTEPLPEGNLALLAQRTAASALPDQMPPSLSLGTLSAGAVLGDLLGSAPGRLELCTLSAGGELTLLRYQNDSALPPTPLPSPDAPARGGCQLASSGRSTLVTLILAPSAAADSATDAGHPADSSPDSLRFAWPAVQLVDPAGGTLPAPQRLSEVAGTLDVEDLLWDGARYLVLLNAAGYRGGRLLLAALDESGRLLFRDQLIPLPVEPGQLLGGRLAATPTGLFLLYGIQRPWDQGLLHLARLELRPP